MVTAPEAVAPATDSAPTSTDSTAAPTTDNDSIAALGVNSSATVGNSIQASATSGDAKVAGNTVAGSASSGNASDMATLINSLQSSTSLQGGGLTTFSTDIYGNVQGDIMIDPSQLSNIANVSTGGTPNDTTINAKDSGQINNDLTLNANTGNATVAANTKAGDATSGNASAVGNIVNVINSIIGSGQSFMGTVNIYGNLDGDILMPPDVLDSLLASNATPTLTTTTSSDGKTLTANLADNTSVNNNLALNAATGTATVSGNTKAGNATTGQASTNLTLLNLTGRNIIGSDALLVFVNVMGQWVGMIVNAPSGSSAAALGGGITDNTAADGSTTVNTNQNSSINNNVSLSAASGNASVSRNTSAGNATTGNASAGLNILNISMSDLALSNWLGILFINVFGSWNGSFGINTAAGNSLAGDNSSTVSDINAVKQIKVFHFVPHGSLATAFSVTPIVTANSGFDTSSSSDGSHPIVLASATGSGDSQTPTTPKHSYSLLWMSGSLFLLAGVLRTEEVINRRKERQAKLRKYLDSITVQPFKNY